MLTYSIPEIIFSYSSHQGTCFNCRASAICVSSLLVLGPLVVDDGFVSVMMIWHPAFMHAKLGFQQSTVQDASMEIDKPSSEYKINNR